MLVMRTFQARPLKLPATAGSFLDLMRNAADLLAAAGVHAPEMGSTEEYLRRGCVPPFVWLWHPAMGPLWSVVAQKICGGSIARGAEVELEIAEVLWRDVHVDGSLLVRPLVFTCSRDIFSRACTPA
jgi:UTP---glucose-1-phosphate uridylyltransferase